jgi:APA family basic amino acid/polyamine antiporter
VFFRILGQVHANYRTPVPAILVMALMAILLVLSAAISKSQAQSIDPESFSWAMTQKIMRSLKDGSIFDLLTNFVIFAASIFYVLAVFSVIVLRWRMPDSERPYRTWAYPVTPVLFLAVYAWFLVQVFFSNPLESLFGLLFIGLGLPFFFGYRTWARSVAEESK